MKIEGTLAGVRPEPPSPSGATVGATIALSASLTFAALFVVCPLLWQVMPITTLPAPFPDTHQDAEWVTFFLVFALLLPLAVVASLRLADRIAAGPNGDSFGAVAAVLAAGAGLVVIVTRMSASLQWGSGQLVLASSAALWWVGATTALRRAASGREWHWGAALAAHERSLWWAAGAALAGTALCFTDLAEVSVPVLIIGVGVSAIPLIRREPIRIRPASARIGALVDIALITLLLLAVPNLVVFVTGDPETALQTVLIQFHQNFFLGPANQVLAGDAMLVETLSQYGVGSIYLLAGAFLLIPIGNGTLGLVEGALSALMFAGTFATLRMAGVSRVIAGAAMTVAVVALVYGLEYPLGGLLQHGAIRFGLPIAVIVGAVAEDRWPRARIPARGLQLVGIALAWIWALEAFAYTMLTVFGMVLYQAAILPSGQRGAHLGRWTAMVFGAGAVAHLLLAAATLAAKGVLPDWGWYLHTLRQFLAGGIGDVTYDFSAFSWGLFLGATYVGSAAALAVVITRRPDIIDRHRTTMLAVSGMTAWGIALFSYLVNRSGEHIIPYVSLPAVALGALWLSLVRRPSTGVGARGRRAALGGALFLATLLVAVAWPLVGERYSQSALAHVVPGGDSPAVALDRLRDRPRVRAGAVEGEELLERYMPDEDRSIVLTDNDLSIDILLRAERGSAIPLGDPIEDSFVPDGHFDPLRKFVDSLDHGTLMLMDVGAREVFDLYRADPSIDPLDDQATSQRVRNYMAPLQRWVVREIGARFDLRTVGTDDSGVEVVELVPIQDPG